MGKRRVSEVSIDWINYSTKLNLRNFITIVGITSKVENYYPQRSQIISFVGIQKTIYQVFYIIL